MSPTTPTTLTIGPAMTIHGGGPNSANILGWFGSGKESLINQGTIDADLPGKSITVGSSLASVTNTGTIEATNAGTLNLRHCQLIRFTFYPFFAA
jgi:hypothetical protein